MGRRNSSNTSIRSTMVYGRILFNNIREYTPLWFRTIPYSRTHKAVLQRQPYAGPAFLPKNRALIGSFQTWIQKNTTNYQIFVFCIAFTMTQVFWTPLLWAYQSNNTHRGLDAALKIEKAYKASLPKDDEDEEEEEDD